MTLKMNFLDLKKIDENVYEGTNLWSPFPGYSAFGGQLSAQSLCAGLKTIDKNFSPTIVHSMFINPGDPNLAIKYNVQNLKCGRTLQMYNVVGTQNNNIIVQTTFCCSLSDQTTKDFDGIEELDVDNYISIEEYIFVTLSAKNIAEDIKTRQYNLMIENLGVLNHSFEIGIGSFKNKKRQIKITILKESISKQEVFLFMTLISDLLIVETSLLALNLNIFSEELYKISSIDHNLYFTESDITNLKTIYYVLQCTNIKECKANIEGKMVTGDGKIICITSQQALIRFKK